MPKGYGLVAKTELLGTGGTIVRCFYEPMHQMILLSIEYTTPAGAKKITTLGPIEHRHLPSLSQTIKDVVDMRTPGFIGE